MDSTRLLGQSVEETGEEYFMTLLHRGFLQDVRQGNLGELVSCEIPAVMHNLAQEASKLEILVANSDTSQFNGKLRHLSVGELNTYPTEDSSVEDFAIEERTVDPRDYKLFLRTFFNLYTDMRIKSIFSQEVNIKSKKLQGVEFTIRMFQTFAYTQ